MYIILMRHGEAVPQTEDITNRERGLTPKGMRAGPPACWPVS